MKPDEEAEAEAEEMTSFLPRGDGDASERHHEHYRDKSSRTGGLLRGCFGFAKRRRRAIIVLFLAVFVFSQAYVWTPSLLGEERKQAWGEKIDEWRPTWGGMPPPPPPPPPADTQASHTPSQTHAEDVPIPIGTSPAGNAVYKPKVQLPFDYDAAMTKEEEQLTLDTAAFPPHVVTYGKAAQPEKATYKYSDGDPHAGVIPAAQLAILDRVIPRVMPPKTDDPKPFPPERWTVQASWSPTINGSKTKFEDAMQPNAQAKEHDWRPTPFSSWQPPVFDDAPPRSANKKRRQAGRASTMPRVQHPFAAPDRFSGQNGEAERDSVLERRRRLVRNAFLHSWEGYKKLAWGHDEIKPVSGLPSDTFNGWGATIVDALDTLLVMELPAEYDLARQHVRDIDFYLLGGSRSAYGSSDGRVPVFETAIRYLGGFLSAYDLAGDELMLHRAEELAQLIMPSFETLTGVPVGRLNLQKPGAPFPSSSAITAEAGSMLLELTRLWQVTGNRTYFDRVHRVTDWLQNNMTGSPDRLGALLPASIFPERGTMYGWYSWGGMIDSAFEYLIKEHQLLGGRLQQYGGFFADVVDSAHRWLLRTTNAVPNTSLLVMGQSNGKTYTPKLEHLACFAGGTIGLGAKLLGRTGDLDVARRVTETCWWAYNSSATGIGPEEMVFYRDKDHDRFDTTVMPGGTIRRGRPRGAPVVGVRSVAADYRNRPETIESVYYMWRLTGDRQWQERGWQMFCSWITHSLTHYGLSTIQNVHAVPAMQTDSMESFVFAETFKYYYLLFSPPSLISLDDYVFTTEAHPLLLPRDGKWARPGEGPRPFWDKKLAHVPASSEQYSGGEMGPVGGMTRVQKHFVYAAWQHDLETQRAAEKAKAEQAAKSAAALKETLSVHLRRFLGSTATAVSEGLTGFVEEEEHLDERSYPECNPAERELYVDDTDGGGDDGVLEGAAAF